MVKCSEVLQCSDGLSNKSSNIIRRQIDRQYEVAAYKCFAATTVYMVVFLFNTVVYVFLLLYLLLYVYDLVYVFVLLYIYVLFMFMYLHSINWHSSATLTEVFPCFFLSCKANARVKPAKTGHGPHSFLCCSMYCLFCIIPCIFCA